MLTIRKSSDRGHFDHGWLDTYHTFSFADYHDPEHMGFRALRVINEDRVAPGRGFGMHGHRDMEIITYVLAGALRHKDSLGGGGIIRPGEVQRISAGRGVMHSETNPSPTEPVHLLQIWIRPDREGLDPDYAQKEFPASERRNRLCLLASPGGGGASIPINADANLHATILEPGRSVTANLAPGRHAWVQAARGEIEVNGVLLRAGDGAAISDESTIELGAAVGAEALLFDLA